MEDNIKYSDDEHEGVAIQETPWLDDFEEKPKTTWTEWLWGKKTPTESDKINTNLSQQLTQQKKILSDYQKTKKKLAEDREKLQKRRTEREKTRRDEQQKRAEQLAKYKQKKQDSMKNMDRNIFEVSETKYNDADLEDELEELKLAEQEDKRGNEMDEEQKFGDEEQMMAELEEELRQQELDKKPHKTMGMKELFATYSPHKKGGAKRRMKKKKLPKKKGKRSIHFK